MSSYHALKTTARHGDQIHLICAAGPWIRSREAEKMMEVPEWNGNLPKPPNKTRSIKALG
jgi:hypothetical protein